MNSSEPAARPTAADVRMRGFSSRTTVEAALAWIDSHASPLENETISIWSAAGRVLSRDVVSGLDVPGFDRSMMDGYAVRATDTQGASPYNRLPLDVVGSSLPGQPFLGTLARGQAVRIMTGAPLPAGADAVLPAERVDRGAGILPARAEQEEIAALDELPSGKNIGSKGEDVRAGQTILRAGRVLRPQDIGVLSSSGIANVEVIRRPRVRIIITGNELLAAGSHPAEYQIADANGPMLAALVARDGGVPVGVPPNREADASGPPTAYIVPDDPAAILAAMQSFGADVVMVSGGSSVGQEDHAPMLLAEHGELAIHGIAMRPSSPTGMGRIGQTLIFLLPGNPVSCLCAYDFFAGRAIRLLGARRSEWPFRTMRLPLARKLVSQVGRVDYARVKITDGQVEPISISGASVLTSTTIADGFVVVPADSEGYPAGTAVEVFLYD